MTKPPLLISVVLILLQSALVQARAVDLIGHSNSEWKAVPGNDGGTFNLETSPGFIATGTSGMVIAYDTETFVSPAFGDMYTFNASLVIPTLLAGDNSFVMGFVTDPDVPTGTKFMELIFSLDSGGNASIQWVGGTTTGPGTADIVLFSSLYSGTGISATQPTDIDVTMTLNSALNWTLAGSITSNSVSLWSGPVTESASGTSIEGSGSSFIIGSPVGEVSDITSGSFSGPVPEPSTAVLFCGGGLMALLCRRRRRSDRA